MLILSEKAYEFGKKLTQMILPAITALYIGLAALWDLPEPEKVAGTIALVTTFLGVMLGISSNTFKKVNDMHAGDIVITENEEGVPTWGFEFEDDPLKLMEKNSVTFKVVKTKVE